MKDHYETKLQQLTHTLQQKEASCAELMQQLKRFEDASEFQKSKDLLEKEKHHTVDLRKNCQRDLAAASQKHRREMMAMKQKQAAMERQLEDEHRQHLSALRHMKFQVLQQDREIQKWKKLAQLKEAEVKKAHRLLQENTR